MDFAVLCVLLLVSIIGASLYSPTLRTRFWLRRRDRASLPLARRHVIEYMRDGVLIANADGVILDTNPAAERILGLSSERIRSQALRSVLSQMTRREDREPIERGLDELQSTCDAASSQPADRRWVREVETVDGRQIEINVALAGSTDRDPSGQFAVLRDRTQQHRDEQVIRRSQKLETVGTLASGLAHEVNNPLAFIRSNLSQVSRMGEIVEERLDDPSDKLADELRELRPIADEALDGIARIEQIVSGMLHFAKGRGDAFVATDVNTSA